MEQISGKVFEKVDMSQYRHTGEGASGSSYDNINDNSLMIKLYNPTYPFKAIVEELDIAQKVYDAGIKSPKPGKLVTDGERIGIMFRKIEGKRSFSRMLADEPERTEEYAREMARLAKELHAKDYPAGTFPNAKEASEFMLSQLKDIDNEERAMLQQVVSELPDGTTPLHGDFHFGNIVTTLPKGAPLSAPHESYFIDLGNFGQGCPLLDVAMMVNICHYSPEEFIFHDMHIHKEQGAQVLRYFLDEYFFAEDRLVDKYFGPGYDSESIITAMRPYYCIKSIFIAYAIGRVLPESREAFREEIESRRK